MKLLIISGTLSSGKTSLINALLKGGLSADRVLIFSRETGISPHEAESVSDLSSLSEHMLKKHVVLDSGGGKTLRASEIMAGLSVFQPDTVIVEDNLFEDYGRLLSSFNEGNLLKIFSERKLIFLAGGDSFSLFMENYGESIQERVRMADEIWISDSEAADELTKKLRSINPLSPVLSGNDWKEHMEKSEKRRSWSLFLFSGVLLILSLFLLFRGSRFPDMDQWATIFLSILLESTPFLMLGVLISGIIQVFIPQEWITKLFAEGRVKSTLTALVAGVFLPVCDCAIIPVAMSLLSKGVPLASVVVFMVAAPSVNPVSMYSTWVAFSGDFRVPLLRMGLGMFVALLMGFLFSKKDLSASVRGRGAILSCGCSACTVGSKKRGLISKILQVLEHSGNEFFDIARFLVLGAFLSSLFQLYFRTTGTVSPIGSGIVEVLILESMAFLMSLCSSSDAFIAKSLLLIFSAPSVMAFLAFGPISDVKNTVLLLRVFKEKFVLQLIVASAVFVGVTVLVLNMMGVNFFR